VTTGPLSYAETLCQPDESTAGPSTPSIGPRRGLAFMSGPEPAPDAHLQPSPLGYVADDQHQYASYSDGSGQ
jgi:hypothetical protein